MSILKGYTKSTQTISLVEFFVVETKFLIKIPSSESFLNGSMFAYILSAIKSSISEQLLCICAISTKKITFPNNRIAFIFTVFLVVITYSHEKQKKVAWFAKKNSQDQYRFWEFLFFKKYQF